MFLFRKKVKLNILDSSRGMSMDDLLFGDVDPATRSVHYSQFREIGKDITHEEYIRLRDPKTKQLYLVIFYENGEKRVHFVPRNLWKRFRKELRKAMK